MTSKQTTIKKAATARKSAAAPLNGTTRISTARHRKAAQPIQETEPAPAHPENRHDAVARIAYGFWEMRGYRDGDPAADWFRAEEEYGRLSAGA